MYLAVNENMRNVLNFMCVKFQEFWAPLDYEEDLYLLVFDDPHPAFFRINKVLYHK